MSGRLRSCSSHHRQWLADDWEMTSARTSAAWLPAAVPGTVASALRAAGQWSLDSPPRAFDAETWCYRLRFAAPALAAGERLVLGFEGLATLAEVWLNGEPLFQSDNMFLAQELDISNLAKASNELLICFAPLQTVLEKKRPRAKWRTPMVAHPQLRWIRTTLLGRTPGWSPSCAPVGPWRPVWLERRQMLDVSDLRLSATLAGTRGRLEFTCELAMLQGARLQSASLMLVRGAQRYESRLQGLPDKAILGGSIDIIDVTPWWPHTHGEPALYSASLECVIANTAGEQSVVEIDLGRVGFRTVTLERSAGDFLLRVNGQSIFCRGAVWTPLDCVSLNASAAEYAEAIEQVTAAGMNMLRVAGPFVYESDAFLDLCDTAGVLLWQDFMFANMDYPAADAEFSASVCRESIQLLARLQARPSLAVLCGNSECAQQAAMSGASRQHWAPPLFETTLADQAHRYCPDVPYCPSSTHGGEFPFSASQGVTSYYGVGAYLQPLADARRSELKFASECLAFANVPETETLLTAGDRPLHFNMPRWKERVPRDMGAGWDFDDVRDRYLERLFRLDAGLLRYSEPDRYLRLARATSGEAMSGAFAEWRRARSECRGALVLFLRDLWPGAGWGIIDSSGLPKAPYYYLKRALQSSAILISDEAANGLMLHIANDAAEAVHGELRLELFKASERVGRPETRGLSIEARSVLGLNAVQLFDGFVDLSYAYRFGPPSYDLMRVSFAARDTGASIEAFHFPLGLPNTQADVGLTAAARNADQGIEVEVESRGFAQSVHIEAAGYVADDQYFHLAPRSRRTVRLMPRTACVSVFEGTLHALNTATVCPIGMRA